MNGVGPRATTMDSVITVIVAFACGVVVGCSVAIVLGFLLSTTADILARRCCSGTDKGRVAISEPYNVSNTLDASFKFRGPHQASPFREPDVTTPPAQYYAHDDASPCCTCKSGYLRMGRSDVSWSFPPKSSEVVWDDHHYEVVPDGPRATPHYYDNLPHPVPVFPERLSKTAQVSSI